ncbi:hypothetical protein ACQKWADRAFT_307594 [Trichoderma austrokoningii]
MYKPAPPRPKKTNICRSRNGCKLCRQRRKKCDERKPCGLCMRLGASCEQFSPTFEFHNVLDPLRSRKAGVQSVLPLYQPNPPSSKPIAVPKPSQTHSRRSPPRIESGLDTFFDPGSLLNTNTVSQPDGLGISYAPEINSRIWEVHSDCDLLDEPLDVEVIPETSINLAPSFLPQQRINGILGFYMSIWRLHCLPALNLTFKSMDSLRGQSSLITDTMATLAASRMSRKLPRKRLLMPSDSLAFKFRPDFDHESFSSELYGSALRRMSCWSPENFDSNPMLAFAALVLFCYAESAMGNFKGFYIHSQGIEELMRKYADRIFPHGAGLLAAWVEIKMQNWWRRAYFGVPEFFQDHFDSLLRPELQFTSNTRGGCTATILWILCESHRLNTAALIACWAKQGKRRRMRQNTVPEVIDNSTLAFEQPTISSEIVALMMIYSKKLDEWRARLPDSMEVEVNPNCLKHLDWKGPEHEAIYFPSHKLAMNMAYYVVARVMQCAGPLQTFANASMHNADNLYEEIEAWIFILLRIAAGIDWEDCVCLNAYTIGFTGLLLACSLSSRSLETGVWIQQWLEKRLGPGGIEEGNFPVFQILDAVRLINRERKNGLDVVALFQTVDDGGGNGKFGSYSSQFISSMLVYGRCRSTGKLASYHVSTRGFLASGEEKDGK